MLEYLLKGGWIMVPLFFLSVLAVAVIIDRLRAFRVAAEIDTDALFSTMSERLQEDDTEGAVAICQQAKGPVASVLLVGLYKFQMLRDQGNDRKEIEEYLDKTMGEYAPHVIEGLEKRIYLLLLIASVSPLLGMTGTVTGMIRSFAGMQEAGVSSGAVAGGISEALITTAAGLIIAIPAVVFYHIFSKKVDLFRLDIEEKASDLVEYVTLNLGGEDLLDGKDLDA